MKKYILISVIILALLFILVACTHTISEEEIPEPGMPVETIDHEVITVIADWDSEYQDGWELDKGFLSEELIEKLKVAFNELPDEKKLNMTIDTFSKPPAEIMQLRTGEVVFILGEYAVKTNLNEDTPIITDIAPSLTLCVD